MTAGIAADFRDLIVVGAGPAGMAAAATATANGLKVLLIDENPGLGGQIYRAIAETPVRRRRILGGAYWVGEAWLRQVSRSNVPLALRTSVWSLMANDAGVEIGIRDTSGARILKANRVIVATGAMERPMPVPGWTLPGVMTVGAAQTLLKSSAMVPAGDCVIAGSGPLLYLLARQLIAAGAPPAQLLDTTPRANRRRAAVHLPAFIASRYAFKGLALFAAVRRRVPVATQASDIRAEGDGRLEFVVWRGRDGHERRRRADLLLLHQGVVPTTNLWSAAGCDSVWDDMQACWHARTDGWGQSSRTGIFIAGDGAGIAGAEAAAARGVLAGLQASHLAGRIDIGSRDHRAREWQMALSRALRGRDFIDALHRPAEWARLPQGDTIVCRCEEITAAQIRDAARHGAVGPNQAKAYLRCGMGPCQGRQCGLAVTELIAEERRCDPASIGHFRFRPPIKPVTLGDLASLPASGEERAAVIRV